MLNGRAFCEYHYARVGQNRRGMWLAMLILIIGLAAFVAAVFYAAPAMRTSLQRPLLIIVGFLLALVPALVWLGVFYLQDRVSRSRNDSSSVSLFWACTGGGDRPATDPKRV
jgi:drug/metabolite transporter (DMT)-like permease